MKTYEISYTKKNRQISAKASGENSEGAMRSYARRIVFGAPIFTQVSVIYMDAATSGKKEGFFVCDNTEVKVEKL